MSALQRPALLLAWLAVIGCGGGSAAVAPEFDGLRTILGAKNEIRLTWSAARPADGVTYHVFRRQEGSTYDFSAPLVETGGLEHADTTIATGVDYFYTVRARRGGSPLDDNGVERSAFAVAVAFPEDDGPHDREVEWWYYTGHLSSAAGDAWGFELTFFKVQTLAVTGYVGNFAITDHQRGTFFFAENPGFNEHAHPDGGFDVKVGDWLLRGGGGSDHIEVVHRDDASGLEYGLTVDLQALKDPVLHGRDGITGEGTGFPSAYYSRTRLSVVGTLHDNGTDHSVTGSAWMDHQWFDQTGGTGLGAIDGWDWFSIQLLDGTDIMLTEVRLADGTLAYAEGTWVGADGSCEELAMEGVAIASTGSWTNPASGNTYPSGWTVTIPQEGVALSLEPVLEDQELWPLVITPVVYWEGEVRVIDATDPSTVLGHGYVELTGYDN
jgi:predicted secreted hydrolase